MKNKFAPYFLQLLVTGILLFIGLRLWKTDLHIPLVYNGDAILFTSVGKAVGEGSLFTFKQLGAPYQLDFVDFAFAQYPDFFALSILNKIGLSAGLAMNLYWLFCVLLSGLLAHFFFHRIGISKLPAFILGVCFSLAPWAFYRHIGHLAYHLTYIPIVCYLAFLIGTGKDSTLKKKEFFLYCLLLFLMGMNNTYYGFFGCLVIFFAWLYSWRAVGVLRFKTGLASCFAIGLGTISGVIPGMLYWREHGKGFALGFKYPAEADIYGMKLRHFFQPNTQHPFSFLRKLDELFVQAQFPLENENTSVRLGLVAGFGLLLLILAALKFWKPKDKINKEIQFLSAIVLGIFLFASIGGFGSFFNVLISPQIRCYNRMGVYILFFSLLAVGFWWDQRLKDRLSSWGKKQIGILVSILLLIITFDQVPTNNFVRDYEINKFQFQEEKLFAQFIENRHPEEDMIFQLPFTEYFGDVQNLNKMGTYDNARIYLHTNKTKWTWGSVSSRDWGWWKKTAALPSEEMFENIVLAGFTGIVFDSFAFTDSTRVSELENLAGMNAHWSSNKRYAFIDLSEVRKARKAYLESPEARQKRSNLLYPLEIAYQEGIYALESNAQDSWRWCDNGCKLRIRNAQDRDRRVRLKVTVDSPSADPVDLLVADQKITLSPKQEQNVQLNIPALSSAKIRLHTSGKRVSAPGDSRKLYFRLLHASVEEIDGL